MKVNRTQIMVKCEQCGQPFKRPKAHVEYHHKKKGLKLFCGKECFWEARRLHKTAEQKKEEKRLYDMEYRSKNTAMLKTKKALAFQNRSQTRREYEIEYRRNNMKRHVEYCRDPEYRAWKKEYDRQYLAKKEHGEFWESALLIREIDQQVNSRMSDYEVRMENGTINKAQQRRRAYERIISIKSENGPLGNA